MSQIQFWNGVILFNSGRVAMDPSCCCDVVLDCECAPCVLFEWDINDDGTYPPGGVTLTTSGSLLIALDTSGSDCEYIMESGYGPFDQMNIRLADEICHQDFPTAVLLVTSALTYGNSSDLAGGMAKMSGGFPYDSGWVPIFKSQNPSYPVGTMRIQSMTSCDGAV